MSTNVEFLLLDNKSQWLATALQSLTQLYTEYERVLVVAENRLQLEQMDELLWHNSAKQFITYSLDTECYGKTVSVLLTDQQPERLRYNSLLNINGKMCVNPGQFKSIIEVVDVDEKNKQQARERYKTYRQLGFTINHREIEKTA